MKTKMSEKSFDYDPIKNKIKEWELKQDFEEFSIKWHIIGISIMSLLLNLVQYLISIPNLRGNLTTTVIVWNFIKFRLKKKLFEFSKASLKYSYYSKNNDNPSLFI